MHVIYDVSHNIAKVEEHMVDGRPKTLLIHRKGSTRAFPPHHPLIAVDYQVGLYLLSTRWFLSIEQGVGKLLIGFIVGNLQNSSHGTIVLSKE